MKNLEDIKASLGRNVASNVLRLASNVADTETITIGGDVFEIDTAAAPGAITAGRIRVDCNAGVTPTIASAAIVAAINASGNEGVYATAISVNEILIQTRPGATPRAVACAETLAGANNAWNASAMYGQGDGTIRGVQLQARAATAVEVGLDHMLFVFPFTPAALVVQVRTSAGALKTWDGVITNTGGRVTVTNGGSSDWAATDVVSVLASE